MTDRSSTPFRSGHRPSSAPPLLGVSLDSDSLRASSIAIGSPSVIPLDDRPAPDNGPHQSPSSLDIIHLPISGYSSPDNAPNPGNCTRSIRLGYELPLFHTPGLSVFLASIRRLSWQSGSRSMRLIGAYIRSVAVGTYPSYFDLSTRRTRMCLARWRDPRPKRDFD